MFTGIIQKKGKIIKIERSGTNRRIHIDCKGLCKDTALGASVAVNGVCLSVVKTGKITAFDVVGHSYDITGLKRLRPGDPVNLEKAIRAGEELSGHVVTGHVDGERKLFKNKPAGGQWIMEVGIERTDREFIVTRGSVAIDGVSLTVGELCSSSMKIFLIPHTLEETIIPEKKRGDMVNVEFDVMAKYSRGKTRPSGGLTEEKLKRLGFTGF
jgi:riboflavin synthase